MRAFIAAITKKLISVFISRKMIIGFLNALADKSKYQFDDELVELGVSIYDGDHAGIIKNAQDLIAAAQSDWAKRG